MTLLSCSSGGAQQNRNGSVAMSSSTPASFVRAWCLLCLSLHHVGAMPANNAAKLRIVSLNLSVPWI